MRRYNPKGKPTKAELEFMDVVAHMSCRGCNAWGCQLHHITEGFRRLGNRYVIALCPDCHSKVDAKGFAWEMEKCREVYEILGLEWVDPPTKIVRRKYE